MFVGVGVGVEGLITHCVSLYINKIWRTIHKTQFGTPLLLGCSFVVGQPLPDW